MTSVRELREVVAGLDIDVMESQAEETVEDPLDREGGRPRTSAMGRRKTGEDELEVARR